MSKSANFLDQAMAGTVLMDEIDDFVDRWHDGDGGGIPLHDYLGMSPDEYGLWIRDPDMLGIICAAKRNRRSLTDAVNDNFEQVRMAARSGDSAKLQALEAWLRQQGKLD